MSKLKTFLRRLKHLSLKRWRMHIRQVSEETGGSKLYIAVDMLWCIVRYGIGYLDYHSFGFYKKPKSKRLTYLTMNDSQIITRYLNDRDYYYVFDDKSVFDKRFEKYLRRRYFDLRDADADTLQSFCKGMTAVFAKATEKCGGEGIRRVELADDTDFAALYAELLENGQYLIEEPITQHPKMSELCPTSINTVRIVTVRMDDVVHFMYALVRIGNGGCVDNVSSGGMYTSVGEDGTLSRPAFCDKTGLYYDEHPLTHTVFNGFEIPFFKEAVEMCKEAAFVEPHMRYVGWDVAITPDGPVFVEGNNLPGYDMCQNARHRDEGILPRFEQVLGTKIRALK